MTSSVPRPSLRVTIEVYDPPRTSDQPAEASTSATPHAGRPAASPHAPKILVGLAEPGHGLLTNAATTVWARIRHGW